MTRGRGGATASACPAPRGGRLIALCATALVRLVAWSVPTARAVPAVASMHGAAGATTEPVPGSAPTTPGTALPPDVSSFLASDLGPALRAEPSASLGALSGTVADLTVGAPRAGATWSREYLLGNTDTPVLVDTDDWVVPLLSEGQPVGFAVISTSGDDERIVLSEVSDDAEGARQIIGLTPGEPVVSDEVSGGWFTVENGRVRALDRTARNLLAGSVPVEDYLPIVAARAVSADPTPEGAETDQGFPWEPVIAVGLLVAILASTFLLVWFRRPDDDADEEPATPTGLQELRRPTHVQRRTAAAPEAVDGPGPEPR